MLLPSDGLLHMPFGQLDEVQTSPRYHWNNAQRGGEVFVMLQVTHRGEGVFEIEGKSHRVPPGHAFIGLLPEDSKYYYPENGSEPWILSWINFYGEFAIDLWRSFRNHAGPVFPLTPKVIQQLRRLIVRNTKKGWSARYEVSLDVYKFYLEALRYVPGPREVQPLQDVLSYFQSHYQKAIRMKEVAAHTGMSREHFTRSFSLQMGCGPAAYLRGIRLEAAARLFRSTKLPVSEIAFRSGWTSASKLDHFFKRQYGMSPSEFRAQQSGLRFKQAMGQSARKSSRRKITN